MVRRTEGAGVKAPAGAAVAGMGERREGKAPSCPPPPRRSLALGELASTPALPQYSSSAARAKESPEAAAVAAAAAAAAAEEEVARGALALRDL